MKKLILTALVVVVCGACFVAGHVSAEEGAEGAFPLPAWMKMGPEQETFKKSAGSWEVEQKIWTMPGQPPMESKSTCKGTLLWDGRFLQTDFHGDMMGMPFHGRYLLSFDRVDKKYVAVWIDSLSTYMSVSRGTEKDGVLTFQLNDPDFMTGQKKPSEMVWSWEDEDTYVLTFREPFIGGEMRTTMQMKCMRVKE